MSSALLQSYWTSKEDKTLFLQITYNLILYIKTHLSLYNVLYRYIARLNSNKNRYYIGVMNQNTGRDQHHYSYLNSFREPSSLQRESKQPSNDLYSQEEDEDFFSDYIHYDTYKKDTQQYQDQYREIHKLLNVIDEQLKSQKDSSSNLEYFLSIYGHFCRLLDSIMTILQECRLLL